MIINVSPNVNQYVTNSYYTIYRIIIPIKYSKINIGASGSGTHHTIRIKGYSLMDRISTSNSTFWKIDNDN